MKNIIFDLGNVLLRFEPLKYLQDMGLEGNVIEDIYNSVFKSKEWQMLDQGTISIEEASMNICSRAKDNHELILQVMKQWHSMLIPIEETVGILKRLKESNYKTYILSNFHHMAFEYVENKYEFFKYFDGGIISYRVKLLKPYEDIYNQLIKEYDLVPGESVFIDDTDANVNTAKEIGFNTVHYKNPEQLDYELRRLEIV